MVPSLCCPRNRPNCWSHKAFYADPSCQGRLDCPHSLPLMRSATSPAHTDDQYGPVVPLKPGFEPSPCFLPLRCPRPSSVLSSKVKRSKHIRKKRASWPSATFDLSPQKRVSFPRHLLVVQRLLLITDASSDKTSPLRKGDRSQGP